MRSASTQPEAATTLTLKEQTDVYTEIEEATSADQPANILPALILNKICVHIKRGVLGMLGCKLCTIF